MRYVIFHKDSTLLLGKRDGYATERAAKAGMTRECGKHLLDLAQYDVAEAKHFAQHIEKTKTVKNLISGKDVVIPVNTPHYCDPSCESYWSM